MAPITEDFQTKRLVTENSPFGERSQDRASTVVALETIREIRVIRGSIASFRLSKAPAQGGPDEQPMPPDRKNFGVRRLDGAFSFPAKASRSLKPKRRQQKRQ
jgi:hypothetical protein